MNTDKHSLEKLKKSATVLVYLCVIFFVAFSSACSQLEKPKPAPFYAENAPPQIKEFRWSNGKLPKSFDPATASAPPETDVVRALYEGLTDTDAKTLKTVPAIAFNWTAADNYRTWIFKLRRDAKWSNGERVTAADFARSWRRLAALGEKIPLFQLLGNITGVQTLKNEVNSSKTSEEIDFLGKKSFNRGFPSIFKPDAQEKNKTEGAANISQTEPKVPSAESESPDGAKTPVNAGQKPKTPVQTEQKFGVEAIDDFTLKVSLVKADKDFPALAAHPIFRPVYGDGGYFEGGKLNGDIVTSGAFRVVSIASDGLTLEKSENFWNKSKVELEKVRFVPMENGEKALEAYRAGELDAVTNIEFEPLALKLLTPFDDFRRTTHGALNFYEFNTEAPPFDDRRVRQALAIAVERERLTEDEMDSASLPALSFSPFENEKKTKLEQDVKRAQNLLAEAGFADGANFPEIRLVVNRNDLQQRVARAVAKMWKKNLNVGTRIIVKEQSDFEAARNAGDYDVLRRGVVLPTTDETVNMLAVFSPAIESETVEPHETTATETVPKSDDKATTTSPDASLPENKNTEFENKESRSEEKSAALADAGKGLEVLTENDAIIELRAVPLYFPTSYSLVKSYIQGFEINALDASSLKDVRIDDNWQPKKSKNES